MKCRDFLAFLPELFGRHRGKIANACNLRSKSMRRNGAVVAARVLLFCLSAMVLVRAQAPKEASAVPALPADVPSNAERYSVTIMGNLAGQQAVWNASDGTVHMFFQFNDRGRGPKTTSILTLDAKGIPVAETVSGNDYLKSLVSEDYSLKAGTARWKNDSEKGEKQIIAPAVYASINGAPAEFGTLVHAALGNGGKIALLPEGEARVERVSERDLENAGQKRHVVMYAVTGLDFSPTYFWLDDHDKFFALVNPWSTIIPDGWEKASSSLQTAQDEISQARAADLAAKLAHHVPFGIVFIHANVFNAENGKIIKDQDVVVAGNRIVSVGPASPKTFIDSEVIDASDKTLLPGLW